jgi:hypothetical protein
MRQFARSLQTFIFLSFLAHAQSTPDPLIGFLRHYVGFDGESKTTEYAAVLVDLKGDGTKQTIVYLSSGGWCGTGGCTLIILVPEGGSYRVLSRIPAVRLPIRLLPTGAHGWHDITVVSSKPLREIVLSFNGESYPYVSHGTDPPAEAKGKVVMPTAIHSLPLYPLGQVN